MNFNFVSPNNLSDIELVHLVQCRDEAAFTELVARYSPRIWHIVMDNSRQRRDAEEIMMDIWLAVWQNIIGLRKAESFGAWLRRVTITACNRYYASNLHRNNEIIMDYEDLAKQIDKDAEQRFHDERLHADAKEAVYQLPQRVSSIAKMYYLDLCSIKEIAEEFNLALGTVKTRLSEIRSLLRKQFEIEPIIRGKAMTEIKAQSDSKKSKLKIIGVGGAGCIVVANMIKEGNKGIDYYCIDTDSESLSSCQGVTTVQIGKKTVQGTGTDGSLALGKKAAAENIDQIRTIVSDAKLVMITAGMGGGTGTSVAPLIASLAREQGALTICFVTRPFDSEGLHRNEQAERGIRELQNTSQPRADALIVIPNQRVLDLFDNELQMSEAFQKCNQILLQGINSITDILTIGGKINIDFNDIEETLRDQGTVLMGIGKASGKNRARIAAEKAINSPLLEENTLAESVGMIVNICSPPDFTMYELDDCMKVIAENSQNAQPIFGMIYKEDLERTDEAIVTLLATGSESQKAPSLPSTQTDRVASHGQDNIISHSNSSEFVHLHNHSEYSLLDSTCRIPEMIQWAVENSSPAVALTDHANMFGAWEFYNTAKSAGVNPIVGCEVNVTTDSKKTESSNNTLYHLTLLAEDAVGYRNLLELTSIGYTKGFHRKPSIDLDILREYHGGIIALTGCINGLIPKSISSNQRDKAVRNLSQLNDIMGEDNLYVEVQNHYLEQELTTYPQVIDLANEFNLDIVGANDCHYLNKSDHRMHDILQCIKSKKTVHDPKRTRFNEHFYFKNLDEMQDAFKDYPPETILNTTEIANRCNLILDYDRNVIPKFDVPEGFTQDSYLEKLCYDGLKQKIGGHLSDPISKQLEYELNVIRQTGYTDYFLLVADYVAYAINQGYLLSARGSAASSLVCYALDIISFNPMAHGCMFDRFINPEKLNPPDIDIDLADNARDDMINYLMNKYGHDSVGKIATFATFGANSSIKDVGRVLEVPNENINKLTELIPPLPGITLDEIMDTVPEFKALAGQDEYSDLVVISKGLEGMKRHVSCHASAVAISKEQLTEYTPLFKDRHGEVATQFEGKTVENIGIYKFDTLGVGAFSDIADCLKRIHENHGHMIALEDIPLEDNMTYSLISEGLTVGLFQLETSPEMYDVVTQLKPDNFEVFSAIVALYRPGPIRSGMMQQFIDRKNGRQPIVYLHPSLESALKSTFGLCIYQEQIMQIACDTAGYTLGEADILREAFGKKKEDIINQHQSKFIDGALENEITKIDAEKIFDYLKSVGSYAFLKSHSVTYSLLSYRMAYLKTHYPQEFIESLINGEAQDSSRIVRFQDEYAKLADFLNVDINI